MKKILIMALLVNAPFIGGCSTPIIQQGKDFSSSGIAYTDAIGPLLDSLSDLVIDDNNYALIRQRLPADESKTLAENLKREDKTIKDNITEIENFRKQTKLLRAYFVNLQALADSPFENDMGNAVKSLSGSIDSVNTQLGGTQLLTPQQQTAIGTLAGSVAKSIQAEKIKKHLQNDAAIIGTSLALQEKQLGNIANRLNNINSAQNSQFYYEKVEKPYTTNSKPLDQEWGNNRKQYFLNPLKSQQLIKAEEAAKQMQGVWADIVSGKTDIKSINGLISDVNTFAGAVQAFEPSSNKK